jgi:hypothetical protein
MPPTHPPGRRPLRPESAPLARSENRRRGRWRSGRLGRGLQPGPTGLAGHGAGCGPRACRRCLGSPWGHGGTARIARRCPALAFEPGRRAHDTGPCRPTVAPGADWALSGVLEHRVDAPRGLPGSADWQRWGSDWSRPATDTERQLCGLGQVHALWHVHAGWIRPSALVRAQLQHPGIVWRGGLTVERLDKIPPRLASPGDQRRRCLAEAQHLVLATAWPTRALLQRLGHTPSRSTRLRGQVTWGPLAALSPAARASAAALPGERARRLAAWRARARWIARLAGRLHL